jgi:hypothetical protein
MPRNKRNAGGGLGPESAALIAALTTGLAGAGVITGSVFLILDRHIALGVLLGIIGLGLSGIAPLCHSWALEAWRKKEAS